MTVTSSGLNTGTGYGRPASSHDDRLTEVGPGTSMDEVLRRYWHPIARSSARKMVDDVELGRTPQNIEKGEAKPRAVTAGVFTVAGKETTPAAVAAAAAGS